MKKINVLQATLHLKMGGLESIIMDLCRHHDRERLSMKVVCFNSYDPVYKKKLENQGIEVVHLVRKGRYDLSFFLKLINLFKQWDIDVLHAHSGCVFNSIICAQLARVPVKIVTEHGLPIYDDGRPMPVTFKTKIEDFIIGKLTDRFVAVSAEIESNLLNKYPAKPEKISTIINGIDVTRFKLKKTVKKIPEGWNFYEGRTIIGSVGRLVPIKNYHCLLAAFALLYKKFPELQLVLVGDGPERDRLEKQAKELGISAAFSILGVRNDIAEILSCFDVFVLPSLTEGTSISLLESQACGIPAVVTRVGGNPDIVIDGINGFLTEVEDVFALSERIEEIIVTPKLRVQMSVQARRTVEQYHDIKMMVRTYENNYFIFFEAQK